MEITSVNWAGSLLQQDLTRTPKIERPGFELPSEVRATFEVPETRSAQVDFRAISPRDLRDIALQSFNNGMIDLDTYRVLAQELPMHSVDATGRVIDLSSISDNNPFDFQSFYHDQLQMALAVGDEGRAAGLTSALNFITA